MSLQAVELLYRAMPQFDAEAIAARVTEITGQSTRAAGGDATIMFVHEGFVVEYADAKMPAQSVLMRAETKPDPADYEKALAHTLDWDEASQVIGEAKAACMLIEMMARGLHPPRRIEIFQATLQAIVERYPPLAIVFKHADIVVEPNGWLSACADGPPISRPGSLNVRFMRTPNGFLMDTRGMDEIGLHDLQCHYRDIEPNTIAGFLYDVAHYIFNNGPVIEEGNTVGSPVDDALWRCQFEEALAGPERDVLDICPDPAHAAGDR